MKYRLKDRALQKKLDDLTKGGFSKVLEKNIDVTFFCEEFLFLGAGSIRVRLFESAFEEVPQYDPTKWNEWPNVTPPAHVLMRVEILTERLDQNGPKPRGGRPRFRGCAKFDGQYWDFRDMAHLSAGETVRFRPWEGKE